MAAFRITNTTTITNEWNQYKFVANKTLNFLVCIVKSPFVRYFQPCYVTYSDTRLQVQTVKTMYACFCLLHKMATRSNIHGPYQNLFRSYVFNGPLDDKLKAYHSFFFQNSTCFPFEQTELDTSEVIGTHLVLNFVTTATVDTCYLKIYKGSTLYIIAVYIVVLSWIYI